MKFVTFYYDWTYCCWPLITWSAIAYNTTRPRQHGRHFADNIFKCIFLNENAWTLIAISLKFVPEGPINNIPALVQIMVHYMNQWWHSLLNLYASLCLSELRSLQGNRDEPSRPVNRLRPLNPFIVTVSNVVSDPPEWATQGDGGLRSQQCNGLMFTYNISTVNIWNLNPLRAISFQREHKHIFTFYVIPPH